MSTYTAIAYHIVFSTKGREPVLKADRRQELFRYIGGILKKRECHLHRVNGVEDHLHILTGLHPSVSLADLVKDIKTGTSHWIKEHSVFPMFSHWQDGYAAFTHSKPELERLIEYIIGQQEHHRGMSFVDEYRKLLVEAGVNFDERYML
ncbi:MAG TPA: IS200/IS605 family transposase [Terriglobia bacterium]|nr:IS200/IS605 family transposase [Terriglobia bacterium]